MPSHRTSLLMVFMSLLSVGLILAQQSQCNETVLNMWREAADNCTDFELNSACYALRELEVDFVNPDDLPEDYIFEQGDIADLAEIENILPVVFDPIIPEWGVAILNIQTNVPETLPGQVVKMFIMGDVQVENGVEPDDAFFPERSVRVEVRVNVNMRYFPRSDSEWLQTVPADAEVAADAVSTSGGWVRVVYNETPGWIIRNALTTTSDAALINLPMISEETQTAMQTFYFTTGIGNPRCTEAPSTILVQGPENFQIDITANGARIRVGSTIMLRTIANNELLQLIVLVGEAEVFPDTEESITVPAGQTLEICLSELRNLGIDRVTDDHEIVTCVPPRPLTRTELEELVWVHEIPPELLNYPIPNPLDAYLDAEVTPEVTVEATEVGDDDSLTTFVLPDNCEFRDDWTGHYVVQVGDNLTWIADSYGLTAYQLAEGNCIEDPDIILPDDDILVPQLPTPIPVVPTALPVTPIPTPVIPPFTADLVTTVALVSPLPSPYPLEASTYIITVTNNGSDNATGVSVAHTMPGILTGVTTATSQGTFGGSTWSVGSLANGASATLTVTGSPFASSGTVYSPTSTVSSPGSETVPADNTGSTTITVNPIIVTSLADPGPGTCTTVQCTLRDALALTDAIPGADTIGFSVTGTILLSATELVINSDVTINGSGATLLTVDGNAISRVFRVRSRATIDGITITNGSVAGDGGAGIFNSSGPLTITNSTISDNTVTGVTLADRGGGIHNSGIANLYNVAITGNSADFGGGIENQGQMNLTNVDIIGNTANGIAAYDGGGGIGNHGFMNLTNVNITGNTANGLAWGGGIANNWSGANMTLSSVTITGNNSDSWGGGIFNTGNSTISLSNVILTGNTATSGGGGIRNNGPADIGTSNITGNTPDDCLNSGTLIDNGGNTTGSVGCPWG